MSTLKIGVLLSGSGTNLQAIIDAIATETLAAKIVHVISSRPDAFGIERASKANIPVTVFDRSTYEDVLAADATIVDIMQRAGAEYLVMAGYMRKVTPVILEAFSDHVLNLHPALLPSFQGAHAIQDAWDAGVKVSGVTVHLANEDYDKGPIVAQRPVAIEDIDTIESFEAKIHAVEHELYPEVLRQIAAGNMSIDDQRKVHFYEA